MLGLTVCTDSRFLEEDFEVVALGFIVTHFCLGTGDIMN